MYFTIMHCNQGVVMTTYFLLLYIINLVYQKKSFQNYHIFFNTLKCAANYVISFEVYDSFIGQKILKLWRQESRPLAELQHTENTLMEEPWLQPKLSLKICRTYAVNCRESTLQVTYLYSIYISIIATK